MPLPIFTIFDTETTGLDPKRGDRIVEIAAVRMENGIILEESNFVQLVNPERKIPWEASQVHKIKDEDVASAPTIDLVLPKFLEFAAGTILVAHNASFDLGFLEREKECCWGYMEIPECFCTLRMSRALFPKEFRHNLDVLSVRLGLTIPQNRHRALPDVLLTAQALIKMIGYGKVESIEQMRKLAGNGVLMKN